VENSQPTRCQGITMEKLGAQLIDLRTKQLNGVDQRTRKNQ